MPYQRHAELVLARWREVERALEDVMEGTREAETLQAEAMRLRDEYQALLEKARENDPSEPPPLQDAPALG